MDAGLAWHRQRSGVLSAGTAGLGSDRACGVLAQGGRLKETACFHLSERIENKGGQSMMAQTATCWEGQRRMDTTLRIGAVNYLNTKPLIHDLSDLAPAAELILDYPSRLADALQRGRMDVALIPIIEYFRAGTYSLVPGIAIASSGPVLSVTLFSKKPWAEIRRLALDEG